MINRKIEDTEHHSRFERATEMPVKGGVLRNGEPCSVSGLRGAWKFRALVTNQAGESWAEVFGGAPGRESFRSFPPDRVSLVKRPSAHRGRRRTNAKGD